MNEGISRDDELVGSWSKMAALPKMQGSPAGIGLLKAYTRILFVKKHAAICWGLALNNNFSVTE